VFRIVNALMALLFAAGVLVQVNDPDPIPWMAIYAAAAAVALTWAVRGNVPAAAPLGVGVVALVWGAAVVVGGPGFGVYGGMFAAWEMDSVATEEAREGTGLLIIAFWMGVLAWTSWSRRRATR
jgi:hypothetical protein